jgi:hypothetical protein
MDPLLERLGGGPRGAGPVSKGDEQGVSVQARPVEIAERGMTHARFAEVGRELLGGRGGSSGADSAEVYGLVRCDVLEPCGV